MSIKFLYSTEYFASNPPREWEKLIVDATIIDNTFEAVLNTNQLTFVDSIATWIQDEYIPTFGVYNGLHFKIIEKDPFNGVESTVFDGYIDLAQRIIESLQGPIIFNAPIVSFSENASTLDKLSIISQGFLRDQNLLNGSNFVDIPTIKESKTNIAERTLILAGLLNDVLTMLLGLIQDTLSAVSDILGVSIPIGVIELVTLAINTVIQVNQLKESIIRHKDLFFPDVRYYKGIGLKGLIEAAFEKYEKTVDFGILDELFSNIYLMPSQSGFDGWPSTGVPENGQLKSSDAGYFINGSNNKKGLLNYVEEMFNMKYDDRGEIVHFMNKFDPFWFEAPEFEPKNIKLETTDQYQNGTIKEDTDNVFATWFMDFDTDDSDAHTLTEKAGDSYEIHRDLITEIDPRTTTLKGLKSIQSPWPLCVRKTAFDNLWDLFGGITDQFDTYLDMLKEQIGEVSGQIAASPVGGEVSGYISELLAISGISAILENRTGVLKIEDNAFKKAKILYMVNEGGKLKIPENFKNFLGPKAIYNNWHLKDSPADVNNFEGQRVLWEGWGIPFSGQNFQQTKENPYFSNGDKESKFTFIGWAINDRQAVTDSEITEIFDTNITEYEITAE